MLLTTDRWFCVRIATATEELGWPKRFTRARVILRLTLFARITLGAFFVFATAAGMATHWNRYSLVPVAVLTSSLGAMLWLHRRRVLHAVEKLLAGAGRMAKLVPFVQQPPAAASLPHATAEDATASK